MAQKACLQAPGLAVDWSAGRHRQALIYFPLRMSRASTRPKAHHKMIAPTCGGGIVSQLVLIPEQSGQGQHSSRVVLCRSFVSISTVHVNGFKCRASCLFRKTLAHGSSKIHQGNRLDFCDLPTRNARRRLRVQGYYKLTI